MAGRDDWRWTDEQGVQRLVRTDELRSALSTNVLPPSTLVWREGMKEWLPAFRVPELNGEAPGPVAEGPGPTGSTRPSASPPPLPGTATSAAPHVPRAPMKTLVGLSSPGSDRPSAPQAPIVVPSGADIARSAVITQVPRFNDDASHAITAIPKAPRLPTDEVAPAPAPAGRPGTSQIDLAWSSEEEGTDTLVRAELGLGKNEDGGDAAAKPGAAPEPKPRFDAPTLASAGGPTAGAEQPKTRTQTNRPPPLPANRRPSARPPALLRHKTLEMSKVADKPVAKAPPDEPPTRPRVEPPKKPLPPTPKPAKVEPARTDTGKTDPLRVEVAAGPSADEARRAMASTLQGTGPTRPRTKPPPPPPKRERDVAGKPTDAGKAHADESAEAHADEAKPAAREGGAKSSFEREGKPPPDRGEEQTAPMQPAAFGAKGADGAAAKEHPGVGGAGTTTATMVSAEKPPPRAPAKLDAVPALLAAPPTSTAAAFGALPSADAATADATDVAPGAEVAAVPGDSMRPPPMSTSVAPPPMPIPSEPPPGAPATMRTTRPPVAAMLQQPLHVPLSSLIGTAATLIVMVVGAFLAGRCSTAGEGQAEATRRLAMLPLLARAALPQPLKPCWVVRQPVRWAHNASKSIPFELVPTARGTLAIGYARGEREAVGIDVEPASGEVKETFRTSDLARDIERVVPSESGDQFLVSTSAEIGKLQPAIHVSSPKTFVFGQLGESLAIAATPDAEPQVLWNAPGDPGLRTLRVQPAEGGSYSVVFRRDNAVWAGWVGADGKPAAELAQVAGSGGSVGKPMTGFNQKELAVVFADRPSSDVPWQIRIGRAQAGHTPTETLVIPLPKGGPGGDAFAPDIVGLADGRWLLVWTEGPAGSRAIRAQTLAPDLTPIGDPIALSPPAGNFGQGVLGVVRDYAAAVFLSKGEQSYELWGAVLRCG